MRGQKNKPLRKDGYVNLLNKYGTYKDNSEAYQFSQEAGVPDGTLTSLYEGNGLFAKIIDTPAEEALKHGFDLTLNNSKIDSYVEDTLDYLEWDEKAISAIKWARLYGGAIIVMLVDDGRGLEEPLDWNEIRSIDELKVFERAVVQPDYSNLYMQNYGYDGEGLKVSRFGKPEFYNVSSMYGSFTVHESRCLVFRNGVLPEQCSNANYQFWGLPEYLRIKRALRETITAHTDSVKMLERSVQAIYSMKGLASLLTTDDGENQVLKRLNVIDAARGLLNSIAIDSDGESYEFRTAQFNGIRDVIDSTCNMLSALTSIPQTILFGRSPAGMNATGESDLENYYNFIEKTQRSMLKRNLRTLLDVILKAGAANKNIDEIPEYKIVFNPLWSMSDTEQAQVEQMKAATAMTKAQTAMVYVDMQALDPSEVRHKLASEKDFNIEEIVEEDEEGLHEILFGDEQGVVESSTVAEEANAEQQQFAGDTEQTALERIVNNEEKVQKVFETALPNNDKEAIIKTSDGAPLGNQNAAGPHKSRKMSAENKKRYRERLVGQKTSDGVEIKSIRGHALNRAEERHISAKKFEEMMQSQRVSPDATYAERRCYDIRGKRMVIDVSTGEIVTVERRRKNK